METFVNEQVCMDQATFEKFQEQQQRNKQKQQLARRKTNKQLKAEADLAAIAAYKFKNK